MSLTIVVPTRNEADNIHPLVQQLEDNASGATVIFVDDSDDDRTLPALHSVREIATFVDVQVVHRPAGERQNGLAGAVTLGISRAQSQGSRLVLVMDGDLQHPPATIPTLVEAAGEADIAIASRYCQGGSADGLDGPLRRLVSRTSTLLAKLLFPVALRDVTDPMTGFFVLRADRVDTSRLRAAGFKILLEVLAHHPHLSRTEVPLQFGDRLNGESNASLGNGKQYLLQLWRLKLSSLGRNRRQTPPVRSAT